LNKACPIQQFPDEQSLERAPKLDLLDSDPNLRATSGPNWIVETAKPREVLLTIDSLGDADPALAHNPDLPAVFVFNRPALAKLQLSSKRIHFYLETLADLSKRRELKVLLGDTYAYANENRVAVTYAPVPSFSKFRDVAQLHPFPWLRQPHAQSVRSFSSWRQRLGGPLNHQH
jgi:deoxyribodipyrimidine photo-lyase